MIAAYLMAACHLAPKATDPVWAEGGYYAATIPLVRVEVDGKEAFFALAPSQKRSNIVTSLLDGGESIIKLGPHEVRVHPIPLLPSATPSMSTRPCSGTLGSDVLDRLSLGFDPSSLKWRVWRGAVPEAEAKAFIGSDPEAVPIFLADNVAWVPFFTAGRREDAILDLNSTWTTVPLRHKDKEAGWLFKSKPSLQHYSFDAGLFPRGRGDRRSL